MKKTAKFYTEFNQLLLSQYPFGVKPTMKAEYFLTYVGKEHDNKIHTLRPELFKEYFERLALETSDLRGEILMQENPSKVPLFNLLLNLISDNISLLTKGSDHYVIYIKEQSIELLRWLKTHSTKETQPTDKPKHDHIFANNGFVLFEHILNKYVSDKTGRQTDIIYYYWRLYNENYIHQRPEKFIFWYENKYNEVLGQWKTIEQVQTQDNKRRNIYSSALDWLKRQS